MTRAFLIVTVLWAMPLAAQQLPTVAPTQSSGRQPVARDTLGIAEAPLRPPAGWALSPSGELAADGVVVAQGLGVRIRSASDVTVFRPSWKLAGTFAVGALFESGQPSASYGLTVGGANGLAFLVRADGAFSVQTVSGRSPSGGMWTPLSLRTTNLGMPGANRLEVRVRESEVTFLINGQMVHKATITPGQLDGVPGVHVVAATDVLVAGFTIESAAQLEGVK